MEPRISYATTRDGLGIAYAVSGEGPPLLSLPSPPDNHVQLEWEQPLLRRNVEALSRHRTLIRFDGRGTGLSDRNIRRYSLEERLLDMEAVVESAGLDRFALLAGAHGCQLAIAYAAANPERLTHLVLVDPFAQGIEFTGQGRIRMMRHLLEGDWDLFTANVGAMVFGFGSEEGPKYSRFFQACVTHKAAQVIYGAMEATDITPLLPQVQVPTLVMDHAGSLMMDENTARRVATRIPRAAFARVAGTLSDDSEELRRQMAEFLGDPWEPLAAASVPPVPANGTLRIILFTDIEAHSEMMARLGDEAGRRVLREHERVTREALREHGGSEVKSMGDGFMASFNSAQRALECAIALQRRLNLLTHDERQLPEDFRIRIGLNAGEPIEENDDLFGASVIAASRIAAQARGGEIFVADVVRQLAAGKGFLFADRGELGLRGLDDPVRVWEVRWE